MSTIPVSVIVLNWNGALILPCCLNALQAQTFRDFETIVVDNASTDHSADEVEACWPSVQVIRLPENTGFCAGNNRGALAARGDWLAFLNNDAFPDPHWLEALLEAAHNHPNFTFFASRLHKPDSLNEIMNAGDQYHASGLAWQRARNQPTLLSFLTTTEVFSACAAAALYRRDHFLQAGGFDEDYFSHFEDVDLGFRLRLLGGRCLYVPDAVVYHLESASFGFESQPVVYQVQRNLVWTYFKNMPGRLFYQYLLAHLVSNLIFIIYYSLHGRTRAVWRAKWDALRGLPWALKKRHQIQSQRKIAPEAIQVHLQRGWVEPFLLGKRSARLQNLRQQVIQPIKKIDL